MEKLALGLSVLCIIYFLLFCAISYWMNLWPVRESRLINGLKALKILVEQKQGHNEQNKDSHKRAA